MTSFLLTVFIACSAILLPDAAFLANPVWLGLLLAVYAIVALAAVLPGHFVQEIVRKAKQRDLTPLGETYLAALFQRIFDFGPAP